MRYVLSDKIRKLWVDAPEYWSFKSVDKFLDYFLAQYDERFKEMAFTLNIYDIQDLDIPKARAGSLNVLLCVENCIAHHHYAHYNRYGDYSDPNIDIYLYNHIDEVVKTDKYIAIPLVWVRLAYLSRFYDQLKPDSAMSKEQQQFAILLSANWRNSQTKKELAGALSSLGNVYNMNQFRDRMYLESCWFTPLFLNFVHNFRFVLVCENSEAPGYITEKIFKCFLARVVPIYWGNNPEKYFQDGCYIDAKKLTVPELISKIQQLATDDDAYNALVAHPKLKDKFDYLGDLVAFVKKNL